jgi:citrate lyase subunit beta/citryl-CoA lyase
LRSCLIVDAQDRDQCLAALESGADTLFVMLGAARDEAARRRARVVACEVAKARTAGAPAIYVQAADLESDALDRDLAEIIPAAPDGVLLEDARIGANVQQLSAKLAVAEALAGLDDGRTSILALIQSPAAILAIAGFSGASARLSGLVYDEDALRMRIAPAVSSQASLPGFSSFAVTRALVALGAGAAGVAAIARLPRGAESEDAVAEQCQALVSQGFSEIAASPRQFEAVCRVLRGGPPEAFA